MSASEAAKTPDKPVYENDRYWTQRLEREFTLAGVGHAGVGLAFNRWAYKVRRRVLLRALRELKVPISGARILELGFGTGYYLDLWREQNVGQVVGFDITEIAVNAARDLERVLKLPSEGVVVGNVVRGVAPDEQPAARDEGPKLGQIELAEIHHAIGCAGQDRPGGGRNPSGRLAV